MDCSPCLRESSDLVWDHTTSMMDRVTVVNCCLGLLCLLLLQGVLNVEGRSIFNSGKCANSVLLMPSGLLHATPLKLVPSLVQELAD